MARSFDRIVQELFVRITNGFFDFQTLPRETRTRRSVSDPLFANGAPGTAPISPMHNSLFSTTHNEKLHSDQLSGQSHLRRSFRTSSEADRRRGHDQLAARRVR